MGDRGGVCEGGGGKGGGGGECEGGGGRGVVVESVRGEVGDHEADS